MSKEDDAERDAVIRKLRQRVREGSAKRTAEAKAAKAAKAARAKTPLKAIDTAYNGYLFRSRLEARWAVFFDALGIRYEYEKEGFELPSGRYLPDFWLPDVALRGIGETPANVGVWVEVKPEPPNERERQLLCDLSDAESSGRNRQNVICLVGQPHNSDHSANEYAHVQSGGCDSPMVLYQCHKCGKFKYEYGCEGSYHCCAFCGCGADSTPAIEKAITKAKQARFEFGEA